MTTLEESFSPIFFLAPKNICTVTHLSHPMDQRTSTFLQRGSCVLKLQRTFWRWNWLRSYVCVYATAKPMCKLVASNLCGIMGPVWKKYGWKSIFMPILINVHIHIYKYKLVDMLAHIYVYRYVCIHKKNIYIYIHIYIQRLCMYIYMYTHI